MCSCGLVSHFECFRQRPVVVDRAPSIHNGAQRVLQTHAVAGLSANLYIGFQADMRAAPVWVLWTPRAPLPGSLFGMSRAISAQILSGLSRPACTRAIGST